MRSLMLPFGVVLLLASVSPIAANDGTHSDAAHAAATLYATGDLDGAVDVLGAAVAASPGQPQLHFMLANGLFRQRDWAGAARHYTKAGQLRPNHPDTHLGLGYASYQMGELEQAVAAWRTAVEQTPADALPHYSLAIGLLASGKPNEARYHAAQAFDRDPDWQTRLAIDIRWTAEMLSAIESLVGSIEPHDMAAGEG